MCAVRDVVEAMVVVVVDVQQPEDANAPIDAPRLNPKILVGAIT